MRAVKVKWPLRVMMRAMRAMMMSLKTKITTTWYGVCSEKYALDFYSNGDINLMLQLTHMYGFGFLPGELL
jgi:hypothetical protein